MKVYIIFLFILKFSFSQGEGGENVEVIGHLEFGQNTSDITGFFQDGREFAAVGLQNASVIVDITDAENPFEITRIPGGNSMWRDLKYWNRYLYVGTEAEVDNGIQIISLDDPDNPFLENTISSIGSSHNVHIDEDGFLYVVGSSDGCDIFIYDLNNPANPELLGCWNGEYIHDLEVFNNKAYACGIYSGVFYIIDLTDKTNPQTILSYQTDSGGSYSTHDAAVTFDENYLIIGDESPGAIISIYDISNYNNINKISEYYTQGYSGNGYLSRSAHNVYIQENSGLLITSFYIEGTRFVDISDPYNPLEVGYYDTSDDDLASENDPYYGNWGTYVDLPSGNIISSDIENGLFILQYNNAPSELTYSPSSFSFESTSNETIVDQIFVTNTGVDESLLTYEITTSPFASPLDGPNENDFYWTDSDNEPSLDFNWLDISEDGILYNFVNNDESGSIINIGFDFQFYGSVYNQLIINPNGWIGFGEDSDEWNNISIPSNEAPSSAIFGFWDDLNPINDNCNQYCSGNVYYHSNNERMVIWFNNVAHWWTNFENSFYDFQIVLYSNGDIDLNYNTLLGNYEDATIGIQDQFGSSGFLISYNSNYLHDNLSIQFKQKPEWLSIFPTDGELISNSTEAHQIELIPSSLDIGVHYGYFLLNSNGGTGFVDVSITLGENNNLLIGDINFDNEINIQDIVLLLNFVLESDLPTNTEFFVSDINADNLLNILDVVQVVNIILSNF